MSPVVWPIDLAILFATAIRAKLNAKGARYWRKATATSAYPNLLRSRAWRPALPGFAEAALFDRCVRIACTVSTVSTEPHSANQSFT